MFAVLAVRHTTNAQSVKVLWPLADTLVMPSGKTLSTQLRIHVDVGRLTADQLQRAQVCVSVNHTAELDCIAAVQSDQLFNLTDPPIGNHELSAWLRVPQFDNTNAPTASFESERSSVTFRMAAPSPAHSTAMHQDNAMPLPMLLKTRIDERGLPVVQLGVVLGSGDTAEEAAAEWFLGESPGDAAKRFCIFHMAGAEPTGNVVQSVLGTSSETEVNRLISACEDEVTRGFWRLKPTREIIRQLQTKPMKYAEIGVGWGATSLHVSEELRDGAEIFLVGYEDEVQGVVDRFAKWREVQELAGMLNLLVRCFDIV
jgi:hypothetical protein